MSARLAALLLLGVANAGCVSMSAEADIGPRLTAELLATVVPGQTSRAEVLERLGPPDEYLRSEVAGALGDDEARVAGAVRLGNRALDVFTWQRDRMRAHGRWWLLYLHADTIVTSDLLMVVFDQNEIVREVSLREVLGD